MPSSHGGAYVVHYTLYYWTVVHVCLTNRNMTASSIVFDCLVPFPIARCLFRLLWQSFPSALNLFRLLCDFSDCSGSRFRLLGTFFRLLGTFFRLLWQSFPIAQQLSRLLSSFFRLLRQSFLIAQRPFPIAIAVVYDCSFCLVVTA